MPDRWGNLYGDELRHEVTKLRKQNGELEKQNAELKAEITQLQRGIKQAKLDVRIERRERIKLKRALRRIADDRPQDDYHPGICDSMSCLRAGDWALEALGIKKKD